MIRKLKTSIILPAYIAEKTLHKTLADTPYEYVDFFDFLVDDKSKR